MEIRLIQVLDSRIFIKSRADLLNGEVGILDLRDYSDRVTFGS